MKKSNRFTWECYISRVKKLFRIMKATIFLLLISGLSVFASETYAQTKTITLQLKNASLKEILKNIEDQSEFYFMYSEKIIDVTRKVTVDIKDKRIDEALNQLFAGTDVMHSVRDRFILLTTPEVSDVQFAGQQQRSVSGTVTDESGLPLPGVTVVVKGTTEGTVTNADGIYTLTNISGNATLVFSFVGMRTQEIEVNDRTAINVSLVTDAIGIDEVVAIGYGTKRRADISGSVSVVGTEQLAKAPPSRSAEQALQGIASGVTVITSGAPGSSSQIFVRGVTNFGNTQPLVIVDGIEQSLNNISPKDIESMQVLKDAGSASIYGVRGANGVILVTTKKGKTGAPVITYDVTYGIQYPKGKNPFNLLMGEDYMNIYNKVFPANAKFPDGIMPDYMYRGPGGAGTAMEGDPRVDPSLYHWESPNRGNNYIIQKINKEGTDWYNELFKRAPNTEHNFSATGGTDKAKYFFGLGYINNQGTMVKSYLKRYSLRVNTEFNLGKHIRVGENLNIMHRDVNPAGGIVGGVIKMNNMVPLKDIMGNWGGGFGGPELGDAGNAVAEMYRRDKNINYAWYTVGNIYAEADFLKYFTARSSLGYNISNSFNQSFYYTPVEGLQTHTNDNSLGVSSGYGSTMTFTNSLNFKKNFDKHNVEIIVGSEAIEYNGRSVSGNRRKFFSDDLNFLILGNGTDAISNSSSISSNALFSLFSRLDYGYNNKYLFSATVRRDGSSVFGPNKRYGVFPSFSLAWRMSEEKFMEGISWLDDMKIRGSYGVLGSQSNVSAQNAFSLFGSGMTSTYYDITGSSNSIVQGFATNRIGNLATGWEENIVTNIGFDMVLFDNTIDFAVEYYKKKIEGLLFTEPLPAVVIGGSNAPSVNIGDIQNTGVDVTFKYNGKIKADFNYSIGANITSYNNKVVDIPDPGYFYAGFMGTISQQVGNAVRNEVGHPVSSFYGYKIIGLFDSDEEVAAAPPQDGAAPGRFRYMDVDKDGEITGDDRTHLGDPNPDFTYGITFNMDYKNFDFSAFFYGSQGNEIFNTTKAYTHFFAFYPPTNKSNDLLNAWTPENKNTNIPKIETTPSFSTTMAPNSFYVEDGSFLKLKSIMLGYTMDAGFLQKVYISKMRLYAQVANLFTLTKFSGLDPELGGSARNFGIESDGGNYPNETSLNFGLSVTF